MKKAVWTNLSHLLICLLALAFFDHRPLAAETMNANSTISEVVVFQDRALVTRRAELDLKAGAQAITFASLPGSIEEDSITAKGLGEAKVILFGAKLLRKQLDVSQSPKVRELEEQIKNVNDQKKALEDEKLVLQGKKEFLSSIKAATAEQVGKDIITKQPSVADTEQLIALLDREFTNVYQGDQQAEIKLRKLDKELDRLQRELSDLGGGKQEASIEVDLEAQNAGRFILEVSYRLPGATWQPLYEARAVTGSKEVELTTYGLVRQNTGEDWKEVSVILSTAKPAVGGRMPEIEPWFVRKYEPPTPPMRPSSLKMGFKINAPSERAKDELRSLEEEMPAQGAVALEKVAQVAVAAVETKGPAVTYQLPKAESIKADWQPQKLAVSSQKLSANMAYETTPRLSPFVYLRAKVKNTTDALFLPGSVQVFLDGTYVGKSWVKLIGPNEEFDLYLGTDERIRAERKELKAKVDVSLFPGLRGKVKTIDYEYLIKVENFKSQEADVTVIDQVPVSQNDEIKVEQVNYDPKPTEQKKEKPGVQYWNFKIPKGGKQEVKMSYRVSYPVDYEVEGL